MRPISFRDQFTLPSARISKTPPVTSGVSVTEPSSSAKVANSSWAIQAALRPQPQSLQYVISIVGVFGMGVSAQRRRTGSAWRQDNRIHGILAQSQDPS